MRDLNRTAEKEISRLESKFADAFDTLLGDVIHDRFREDEQLQQMAAAYGTVDAACTHRDDENGYDDAASNLDKATGHVKFAIEKRSYERLAELCELVAKDAGEWADIHDEDDLREAVWEARQWLARNTNPAERAGVDYGNTLPDVDELFTRQGVIKNV
ncbi:hypothetical protein C464_06125 [Halorubrum coriense DSM 10284]|uniref:Uncharacterized protein n=1 Tax=Halorubrum coriense DSM 10284 TaxID=1227466 RepID=M0EML2_9EURY|nr:hypothetical protein [Halorubrum coriense]ELZ48965.1 hypothetical protein C464_06125 [Halorubrum coriense DSM 10284]QRG24144.1 hypothetical protein HrrHm1_165 [Halorubrum virus Humcor1]